MKVCHNNRKWKAQPVGVNKANYSNNQMDSNTVIDIVLI